MAMLRICSDGGSDASATNADFYFSDGTTLSDSGDLDYAAESLRFFSLFPPGPEIKAEF